MAFVVVGFALRPRLQHRDRPVADEIVETLENAVNGLVFVLNRDALGQHGLEHADQKERRKQVAIVQMSQQVGVMRPVGRQDAAGEGQRGFGLAHVAEGGGRGVQFTQPGRQGVEQRLPGRDFAAFGEEGVGVVELLLPARVGPAVGEVQPAQQPRQRRGLFQFCETFVHRDPSCLFGRRPCSIAGTAAPCQPGLCVRSRRPSFGSRIRYIESAFTPPCLHATCETP